MSERSHAVRGEIELPGITRAKITWEVKDGWLVISSASTDPFSGEKSHAHIGVPVAPARAMARRIIDGTGGDDLRRENSELKTEILKMDAKGKAGEERPVIAGERYPERCEPVELEYGTGHSLAEDGPIKCRRAMASEVASETGGADLDSYVERLDEGMQSGAIGHAWGDYESALVVKRPGADEAFTEWCDRWLEVKAHVNEDDEEQGR